MGTLFIVGTPIGNLEDISLRALRILNEVDVIAAEDTRRAKILLQRYKVTTPVISYHEQGSKSRTADLLRRLHKEDVALISEAGMPSISDPGFGIVSAAISEGLSIDVIPGPSAVPAALVASGLPTHQFTFVGFAPRKVGERRRFLQALRAEPRTLVFFEAPHRLKAMLEDMLSAFGQRRIGVCRELTKLHQEIFHGSLGEAVAHFGMPRGEFTLVVEGAPRTSDRPIAEAKQALAELAAAGVSGKEAIANVVQGFTMPHREIYSLWLEAKEKARGMSGDD